MRKILFLLICFPLLIFSQNEGNIWYFGYGAGLDFNSGSPVPIHNGQLQTLEGCATISDNNGNLLFYTDGMTVYDRNHTVMPNGTGLLGDNSSTQSGVIVQQPGSASIYYIFSVDGITGSSGGLAYSEVDLTLNGGLGDITSVKNIMLFPQGDEKVTAVPHQNGVDYWVVSRLSNTNEYRAYLLSSTGFNPSPVVTTIGPIYPSTIGYMKGSPNGNKLAVGSGYHGWDLIDFDNSTGVLTNLMHFEPGNTFPLFVSYGVEFSPDGNLLYISNWYNNWGSWNSNNLVPDILQYNLLAGTGSQIDIENSVVVIAYPANINGPFGFPNGGAAIQLAPDGKIYHVFDGCSHLSAINNPNIIGAGCNYVSNVIDYSPGMGGLGLPTFFSSIFNAPDSTFSAETACDIYIWDGVPYTVSGLYSRVYTNVAGNDSTHTLDLTINYTESQASITTACDSYTFNGQTFTTSGIYVGIFTNQGGCDSTHTLDLTINSTSSSSSIVTECDSYTLNGIIYTSSGIYTSNYINNAGCDSTHTLDLTINYTDIESSTLTECDSVEWDGVTYTTSGSYTNLYTDVTGCDSTHTLNLTINNSTYSSTSITECDSYWWPLDNTVYTASGTYTNISTNNYGCVHSSTLVLTINNTDSSSNNHTICKGESITIGSNVYSNSGIYTDVLFTTNGCDSTVTTYLTVLNQISTFSFPSYPSCVGYSDGSIDINTIGGIPPYSYSWSTGDTTEDISSLAAGTYALEITDSLGCMYTGVFNILQPSPLQLSMTSTDTTLTVYGSGGNIPYTYQITGPAGFMIINLANNGTPYTTSFLISGTYTFTLTDNNGCVDSTSLYINNSTNAIIDYNNSIKRLIKITDLLGRETKGNKNQPLLYIYDDGTVEKKIAID